jgi:hypothetical protein
MLKNEIENCIYIEKSLLFAMSNKNSNTTEITIAVLFFQRLSKKDDAGQIGAISID